MMEIHQIKALFRKFFSSIHYAYVFDLEYTKYSKSNCLVWQKNFSLLGISSIFKQRLDLKKETVRFQRC